ncbi:hypothetical protein [Pantoea sp. NGS-ED-1003]|uniref:hypothetical protein n=1 Tax=Pantoea sp. NGS-ED-1003 TaxID=1526743 RepID=UPI00053530F7|nr:hypothetical protein [Pantoea sp. NGS-ED-1003]DAL17974.1 MAG TPA_asm: hypothetical protein [Caudoviricetes sp.]
MSDEEVLELAAKAAGHRTFGFDEQGSILIDPVVYTPWNPLRMNVDAFQLARQMDMSIHYGPKLILVTEPACACSFTVEIDDPNIMSLTRKAITHLAASVGEWL